MRAILHIILFCFSQRKTYQIIRNSRCGNFFNSINFTFCLLLSNSTKP